MHSVMECLFFLYISPKKFLPDRKKSHFSRLFGLFQVNFAEPKPDLVRFVREAQAEVDRNYGI